MDKKELFAQLSNLQRELEFTVSKFDRVYSDTKFDNDLSELGDKLYEAKYELESVLSEVEAEVEGATK